MPAKKQFNEDTRVKIPATLQFLRLGYNYQSLKECNIDFYTKIFINRFKPSLEKINNTTYTDSQIQSLLSEIHSLIKNNDLGREFYKRLTSVTEDIKLIDWDNIENNDFAVVDELPFTVERDTEENSFRPDINILINGMPLAFLEVKKPNNEGTIQAEFKRMLEKRLKKPEYKKFFNLIQFVSFSNNMEYENSDADSAETVKAGSFYSTPNGMMTSFSFFREDIKNYHENYLYGTLTDEYSREIISDLGYDPAVFDTPEFTTNNTVNSPCNRFITSMFDKERFLYILHYGILYVNEKTMEKHIMRYPQFFATRAIVRRLDENRKRGIVWHTQGSGKTELSAYTSKILTDYYQKKNINARFFFIVDRLDLLRQDNGEFSARYFKTTNCTSKKDFSEELQVVVPQIEKEYDGEFVIVNIQKFESAIPKARNEYNANIQRVFFIDEAHRSYAKNGEYFKNLILCDPDAVFIALTGTPLLSKKERSNLKFGDYIHKYFYDKSIADGYTLRIKKEKVGTIVKKKIKADIQIEQGEVDFNDASVYESDAYVEDLGEYIEKDFRNFRQTNQDNTIGGMIVCKSNPQAKKVYNWFKEHSKLSVGLVISDQDDPKQDEMNKNNQNDFKYNGQPDLLVVHFMLTTGYDVKRLKKMYLLRGPQAQNLLQTISRVNRPYKSPSGKIYQYGYITDFVDIEAEYDRTINDYLEELEKDINDTEDDGESSLSGLLVDLDTIRANYKKAEEELDDIVSASDLEKFSQKLSYYNRETLYKVKHHLNTMKDCYTEFLLSEAFDDAKSVDIEAIKQKLKITQNRIDCINFRERPTESLDLLSDTEIVEIMYEFFRVSVIVVDISKFSMLKEYNDFQKTMTKLQHEIKKNRNKDDIRLISLDEALRKIFENLKIHDASDIEGLSEEIKKILAEAEAINRENDRLAAIYDNNYSMVKTYQDSIMKHPELNNGDMEEAMKLIYSEIKDVIGLDTLAVQGREGFITETKKKVTVKLLNNGLYKKLNLKDWINSLLSDLYTNLQNYK